MRRVSAACALVLLGCAAGCDDGETSLRVDVSLAAGEPEPTTLMVSVYEDRRALVLERALASARLPGSLILRNLPARAQRLRVVMQGGAGLFGFAVVQTESGAQVRTAIALSRAVVESDGDGVPDLVDNCVTVENRDQADADGDGAGDVCDSTADGGSDGGDAAVVIDMAGHDLAGVDLAGSDLSAPPDMTRVCRALYCDDFERGTLPPIWSINDDPSFAEVSIDSQKVPVDGTRSLKAHVFMQSTMRYLQAQVYNGRNLPQSTLFVRAYLYLPSPTLAEDVALIKLTQTEDPFGGVFIAHDSNGRIKVHSYYLDPGLSHTSATSMPADRWFCLEWQLISETALDGGVASGLRVWLDDVEVADLNQKGAVANPVLSKLWFGVELQGSIGLGPYDVWYDAIAVDNKRIGCAL